MKNFYNNLPKKHNFAVAVDSTTYAGELALPFLAPAVKSGKTLSNNWVRIIEGVRKKAVLERMEETASILKDATCDFSDAGTGTLKENVLSIDELQVNLKVCKKTLRTDWAGQNMQIGGGLSSTFEEFLMSWVASRVASAVETSIWQGDGTDDFLGFCTASTGILNANSNVVDVDFAAGSTGSDTLTTSNVYKAFNDVYDSAVANASGILEKEDVAFYCSSKTMGLYAQYLAGAGFNLDYYANEKPANYLGIPIYSTAGMLDNQIVMTYRSNLVFGTDLQTDYTNVAIIDRTPIDGSDNVYVSMRFGAGVQVGVGADVVYGQ